MLLRHRRDSFPPCRMVAAMSTNGLRHGRGNGVRGCLTLDAFAATAPARAKATKRDAAKDRRARRRPHALDPPRAQRRDVRSHTRCLGAR